MNNQQKYINYVVEDLVKNTEIDNEQQKINAPSPFFSLLPNLSISSFPIFFLQYHYPSILFSNYIKNLYGTRDEELLIIWDQYRNRIQSLIKKIY